MKDLPTDNSQPFGEGKPIFFTPLGWALFICLVYVLATMRAGCPSGPITPAIQAKALSHARNIGMALLTYAEEHNGEFPKGNTAAEVFSQLLLEDGKTYGYISDRMQFYVKGSAYTPPSESSKSASNNKLEAGENHWAFMQGLRLGDPGRWPLLFDGPATPDGTYSSHKAMKGGVWEGKQAIVVRLDGSVKAEYLKDLQVQTDGQTNVLVPTSTWATGGKLLMPW